MSIIAVLLAKRKIDRNACCVYTYFSGESCHDGAHVGDKHTTHSTQLDDKETTAIGIDQVPIDRW